jgi:hypothetical protein
VYRKVDSKSIPDSRTRGRIYLYLFSSGVEEEEEEETYRRIDDKSIFDSRTGQGMLHSLYGFNAVQ